MEFEDLLSLGNASQCAVSMVRIAISLGHELKRRGQIRRNSELWLRRSSVLTSELRDTAQSRHCGRCCDRVSHHYIPHA